MKLDEKVFLGRLYERTSQRGNRYFSGRLGPARVMLFRDENADTDNVWQLFVQDGDDKAAQTGQEGPGQQKTTPDNQIPMTLTHGPENAVKDDPEIKPLPLDDPLPENLLQ